MKRALLILILISSAFLRLTAQTYTGQSGALSNDGTACYFPVTVSGLPQSILDNVFGLEKVTIKITHPYDAELEIKLIDPQGNDILLSHANGGSGDNYYTTCFHDFATIAIQNGAAPFNGSYRPQQPLGNANNGQDGNGSWQLYVRDLVPNNNNTGYMAGWEITFGYTPGPVFNFISSNLPIVLINTHGQPIPDDPKIAADFSIIDNGAGVRNFTYSPAAYSGIIGIELRGSSSQSFPKKSYGFETWDVFGQSIDTMLLGMPSESDWILNANYTDKTFCRNVLAYQTWMDMSHYATRYRFVEVVLNGDYQGIYILSEKIKRGKDRVDIAKLKPDDNSGDRLTGGYILKVDKSTGSGGDGWVSPFPPPANPSGQTIFIMYEYPKSEDITTQQKAYIKDYVTDFETALEGPHFADTLIGFRKYAQELTFIDYFLVNEISKNVDGYRLSTFFHKERDSKGGKLRMGPVWDYDIAWHNADYCGGDVLTGWAYQFPCEYDYWQVPFWWARLLQDPLYASHLKCRWLDLRSNVLSNNHFTAYIDSVAAQLDEAQYRNFITWPILGVYVWPNPWPYPATYAEEISSLKSWLINRLAWLDTNLPGTCYTVGDGDPSTPLSGISLFPNPASELVTVGYEQSSAGSMLTEILSQSGAVIRSMESGHRDAGFYTDHLNVRDLKPGIYILRMTINGVVVNRKLVKI